MKYSVEIVKLGEMVEEFIEGKMLIIFNENAPKELAEISVLHTIGTLEEDVEVGDKMSIGDMKYEVVAVGCEANNTLRQLGHCTLKFNDSDTSSLPGVINLKGEELKTIKIGDTISIY